MCDITLMYTRKVSRVKSIAVVQTENSKCKNVCVCKEQPIKFYAIQIFHGKSFAIAIKLQKM